MTLNGVGEGTGSGLYTSVAEWVSDLYYKVPKINFAITPSKDLASGILEPYNAVLSFNAMLAF